VFGNRSYQNLRIGIRNISSTGLPAAGADGTVIENNHVFENGPDPMVPAAVTGGILVGASTDVTVRNNRSERNNRFGIRLQNGAVDNLVEKNEVFQNSEDGILLLNNADLNTVQLNVVRRNGRDGIRIFDPGRFSVSHLLLIQTFAVLLRMIRDLPGSIEYLREHAA